MKARNPALSWMGWVWILILIGGLWGARRSVEWIIQPPQTNIKADLDCIWIMTGIEPTETFAGTLRWWTGPWCMEFIPYYRPMTSTLWWFQYQLFGMEGLRSFTVVHLISHLLLLLLATRFFMLLLGTRLGALAVGLYAVHAAALLSLPTARAAFPVWKDSCDIWCAMAYVGSLTAYLHYLRSERPRFLMGAYGFFVLAISFKEMAYTLPFLAVLLAWYEGKLKSQARELAGFFGIAAAAWAFRWWALEGWGFRTGTNGAWLQRGLLVIGGPLGILAVRNDWFPVAILLLITAAGFAMKRGGGRIAWGLAGLGMAAWVYSSAVVQLSPLDLSFRLLMLETWVLVLWVGFFLLLFARFLQRRERGQIFGYGWAVITQLPLLTQPIGAHGLYFVALGWAVWLAYAMTDGLALLKKWAEKKYTPAGLTTRQAHG